MSCLEAYTGPLHPVHLLTRLPRSLRDHPSPHHLARQLDSNVANLANQNKSEMDEAQIRALEEHEISQGCVPGPDSSASLEDGWHTREGEKGRLRADSGIASSRAAIELRGVDGFSWRPRLLKWTPSSRRDMSLTCTTPCAFFCTNIQSPLRLADSGAVRLAGPCRPPQQPQTARQGQGV